MQHDNAKTYRLLSAQSALGQAIYAHYGMDTEDFQSNILMANGSIWLKSEGSIRMAEGLGLPCALRGLRGCCPWLGGTGFTALWRAIASPGLAAAALATCQQRSIMIGFLARSLGGRSRI